MGSSVRITGGPAYELLLGAVAVADADWRSVLTHGGEAYDAARSAGGVGLVRDVARFGRFGWINLLGPLAEARGRTRADLEGLVAEQSPRDLRRALAGGRRRQLAELVESDVLDAALDGVPAARRKLRRAMGSERTVLELAPWLLATDAAQVKRVCRRVLRALPDPPDDAPPTRRATALLRSAGAPHLLELVAPGVRYADDMLDTTVLVTTAAVAPVVMVVDEADTTVIVHPPLEAGGPTDASIRLRDLARATGDQTRMRLLQELRSGPRTLAQLCEALASPRTTLLHHLALLRATGLLEIAVVAGEPNVYQLRQSGFDEFVRAVRGFTIGSQLSKNIDT